MRTSAVKPFCAVDGFSSPLTPGQLRSYVPKNKMQGISLDTYSQGQLIIHNEEHKINHCEHTNVLIFSEYILILQVTWSFTKSAV